MAVVALAALVCGMIMARLRQPTIVGYIIAGILLGPSALGLVQDREQIGSLAELGVLMLLFLIGMELSVRAFMVSWRIALSAVAMQIVASLLVILACSAVLGFSFQLSILLGFVVALSSTAVAIKMMEEIGELRTRVGRITVGILIGQDLAFLPMLLITETLGAGEFGAGALFRVVISMGILALLLVLLNRRRRIELPFAKIFVGNVDLSPLTGLAYCFGAGTLFGLLGLSAAYGAFLAGLVIGKSTQREQMIQSIRPVQSVLVMVFFLSIGLLIDLRFVMDNIGTVLLLLLVVTLFKMTLNVAIMRYLGETWQRAFMEGALISQLGEFSFVLAAAGLAAGAIGQEESRLIIAVTVLSLMLSPLWLTAARRVHDLAADNGPSLRDILGAAYGGEAAKVREGSSRLGRWLDPMLGGSRGGAPPAQGRARRPANGDGKKAAGRPDTDRERETAGSDSA